MSQHPKSSQPGVELGIELGIEEQGIKRSIKRDMDDTEAKSGTNENVLTSKQREVFDFIRQYKASQLQLPSVRQIGKHLHITSRAVQQHIIALKKKAYLRHQDPITSSYALIEEERNILPSPQIPWVGSIAAGSATTGFAVEDRFVPLDQSFFGRQKNCFALQVAGNSMSGDYIKDGDIAIIATELDYRSHDILAVQIDCDEFTLKRVSKRKNTVTLIPSNPDFPIKEYSSDRISIVGKYIGLIRKD